MMNRLSTFPARPERPIGSQLPLVLLLNAYAAAGALFISRAILRALEISGQYWVGRQIFRATNPFGAILELFPGGAVVITGQMTVADLTLVLALVLFPLGILAFGGDRAFR